MSTRAQSTMPQHDLLGPEVIDVGADGLVHVRPLPGPVSAQRLAAAGGGANSSTDGASRAPNAEGTIVVGT